MQAPVLVGRGTRAMTSKKANCCWLRYWPRLFLVIPLLAILWVPSYNKIEPALGGVPFFSWLPPAIHARYARARIYTRRGTVRLLTAAGFQVLASRYLAAPMDVIRNRALAGTLRATIFRGPGTRIPFLSTSIFIVARRLGRPM